MTGQQAFNRASDAQMPTTTPSRGPSVVHMNYRVIAGSPESRDGESSNVQCQLTSVKDVILNTRCWSKARIKLLCCHVSLCYTFLKSILVLLRTFFISPISALII